MHFGKMAWAASYLSGEDGADKMYEICKILLCCAECTSHGRNQDV